MASGLAALLDDIAGIAKLAAASLDDVAGAAGKAGTKAVGVVVDDTAVTPGYAVGFSPDRELPIVARIAIGSLKNKLIFLLPGAMLLSAFAPWAVTPILMLGGTYLCFEASEKILEVFVTHEAVDEPEELALSSKELEKQKVDGAIRTDLILSAEIMAISLGSVTDKPLLTQGVALLIVGVLLTIAVYGAVAVIVKMDDIGLHMSRGGGRLSRGVGRGLVKAMPFLLEGLTVVGTAAMLWVGGGIIVHGLEHFHLTPVPVWIEAASHWAAAAPGVGPLTGWLVFAAASSVVGLIIGAVVVGVIHLIPQRPRAAA
ncbi:MAG: DUF808 family protein [Caulobacter sp.]|nr:DUF808 family protein [Caulobacter sp.]